MRLLLDESLPRHLRRELLGHEVLTVPEIGWLGKSDGELIRLSAGQFDAFITADQNLQYQQNLSNTDIPIIVMVARTNRVGDLSPLIPIVIQALEEIESGQIAKVSDSGIEIQVTN